MNVIEILKKHEKEIKDMFGVRKLGVFGSYVREKQKDTSDIDLLVEFEKPTFDNFMDLAFYLEDLFGRSVDILTPEGVKGIRINEIAEEIKRSVVYV
ncbi:MAG TPA: nucleotidyltransferase [Methanosarcinales archaeon]|nr:nucleotidyltransferase [Methanosarcinales archaeon]